MTAHPRIASKAESATASLQSATTKVMRSTVEKRRNAKRNSYRTLFVSLILITTLLTSCSLFERDIDLTVLRVQLNQPHNAEYAGFYTAIERGFYTEENLAVELIPHTTLTNPVAEVIAGNAEIGITSGDQILLAQSTGNEVMAISSIYQLNPLMIMSLPENGISTPQDLVGKRIGVNSADLEDPRDLQFLALLRQQGIDLAELEFITTWDYFGAYDLTSGRLAAISGFSTAKEAIYAELEGDLVTQIYYNDYGVFVYPNLIFTNAYLTRSQPELVNRFIRATVKGYQYALEHPREAAEFCVDTDNTLDLAQQAAIMQRQMPLINTGYSVIGWMDEEVWRTTQEILLVEDKIAAPLELTIVFTNIFVNNVAEDIRLQENAE